jgi:uncharacterized protein
MVVYSSTCGQFRRDADAFMIAEEVESRYEAAFHRRVSPQEKRAWRSSLDRMETVVRNAGLPDSCGVLIEFSLPNTSRRIDFIIAGTDRKARKNFVIIELKQWEQAGKTALDAVVTTALGGAPKRQTVHPSYQAYSYQRFFEDFNEAVYTRSLNAHSCAFLHNYCKGNPEPLLDECYRSWFDASPLYLRDDKVRLQEFLAETVGCGRGTEILYEIETGVIRPSRKLADAVGSIFRGSSEFVLIDEQKTIYEQLMQTASKAQGKTVIIVQGGPGTGKSVLSFNVLAGLLSRQVNAVLSAPNAAFRDVMKKKLLESGVRSAGERKEDRIILDTLIRSSAGFVDAGENVFDVIITDESHRLKNGTAYQYRGDNQVEDIVKAARVSIFFVDDSQMIRPEDIGSCAEIRRAAGSSNAAVHEHVLETQFRCGGLDGYVQWLDSTLHICENAHPDGWDSPAFEFGITDTPGELYRIIRSWQERGASARMLAGYAWEWTSEKKGNRRGEISDVVIPECSFAMPWNSRSSRSTWAIDPSGIGQVGCIHTSQGLEFDYVGVIIGNDLRYDANRMELYADWESYKDINGKKRLRNDPEKLTRLVKQVYRTLMTRGLRGCYVYCRDPALQTYLREAAPRRQVAFTAEQRLD